MSERNHNPPHVTPGSRRGVIVEPAKPKDPPPRVRLMANPLAVDVKAAAAMVGISPRMLADLIKQKTVPSFRIGRRVLVSVKSLSEWVRSCEKSGGVS